MSFGSCFWNSHHTGFVNNGAVASLRRSSTPSWSAETAADDDVDLSCGVGGWIKVLGDKARPTTAGLEITRNFHGRILIHLNFSGDSSVCDRSWGLQARPPVSSPQAAGQSVASASGTGEFSVGDPAEDSPL